MSENGGGERHGFGTHAWEWVGGYVVVAWAVVQVTDTVASLIGLPLWFGKAVVLLVVVGLVVVLATAALQRRVRGTAPGSPLRRLFTWRNAGIAGLVALALLGLGTAAHLGARSLGLGPVGTLLARGVLTEESELVLADFEDHADDEALARALTQAFRAHLTQSPTVRLASPARVSRALDLMEAGGGPLDRERAREVAIREGLKAVVAGEVHRLGSGYAVSATVLAAESGEELATALESAAEAGDLIGAVERLSIRLRERIGESLSSVRRSPPLSRVRTASLAALKSYTAAVEANGRGDFAACALLNEQAIGLDSLFAMAYVGRAACNQNLRRHRALQVSDRVRAYGMRERMTERERLQFTAIYHQFVTEDRPRAVEAWEAYIGRYPGSPAAHFALANLYAEGREWVRAEAMLRQGLAVDPEGLVVLINLAGYQTNRGLYDQAHGTLDRLERELPALDITWWRAVTHVAEADWSAAGSVLATARAGARGSAAGRGRIAELEASLAAIQGRLSVAERVLEEALATDTVTGDIEGYHRKIAQLARLHLRLRGDSATAIRMLDGALAAYPLERLEPLDRNYLGFAGMYADAGRPDRSRRLVEAWESEVAPLVPGSTLPAWLRAELAEAEGRYGDALVEWRREDEVREDPVSVIVRIAGIHDRLGRADSAIAYYSRYLTTPSRQRYYTDQAWRGPALERLADLLAERGAWEQAARHYGELAELWDGADPALQPRVARARARVREAAG